MSKTGRGSKRLKTTPMPKVPKNPKAQPVKGK